VKFNTCRSSGRCTVGIIIISTIMVLKLLHLATALDRPTNNIAKLRCSITGVKVQRTEKR